MPLRDVARHVDAAEKEWDAAQAGPLKRRKAMAGLFEADAKAAAQPVDIVAHLPRSLTKLGVGHQQRARGIIAKTNGEQPVRALHRQGGTVHHVGDYGLSFQHHQLVR